MCQKLLPEKTSQLLLSREYEYPMTLVILPVCNEENTIENTIEEIKKVHDYEWLFIDDGSIDKTKDIVKEQGFRVYRNVFDRGKGSALKAAYVYCNFIYKLQDDDNVVFMDGDGQIDPRDIQVMLNVMQMYNADVVMGNKRHLYSQVKYGFVRNIVSRTYNFIVRVLFGFSYQDTQCGIKVFKKFVFDSILEKVSTKRYAFDVELLVALREGGFRIADAPVNVRRQKNKGAVSFKNILKTSWDTFIIWYNKQKGVYLAD